MQIITTLIADGVASSPIAALPEPGLIEARAEQKNAKTLLRSDFSSQPVPYGAYFLSEFTGATPANVYPPRTTTAYLVQLAGEHDQLYRDIFQLDDGFLPDNVVDALLELKDLSLNVFCRQVLAMQPATRFGYWPEDELNHATFNLGILQAYFSSKLGYEVSRSEEIVKNAVTNALNKKKQANVTPIGVARPGANSQT